MSVFPTIEIAFSTCYPCSFLSWRTPPSRAANKRKTIGGRRKVDDVEGEKGNWGSKSRIATPLGIIANAKHRSSPLKNF